MARCPNCGQETKRTTDMACAFCGYPLPGGGFKALEVSYLDLIQARRAQAPASEPPAYFAPPPQPAPEPEAAPELPPVEETPEEVRFTPPPESDAAIEPEAEAEAAVPPEPEAAPEPETPPEPEPEPEKPAESEAEAEPPAAEEAPVEEETVIITPPPEPEPEPELAPEPEAEPEPEAAPEPPEEETVIVTPPPEPEPELPPPPPPTPAPKGEVETTIEQINAEYAKDAAAADRANEGRTFKLSGIVEGIGRDLLDNPYVKLRSNDESAVLRVRCTGSGKAYEERVTALQEGETISVSGKYDGFLVNILLKDCTIL